VTEPSTQPALAVEGLSKRFGATVALAGVDLQIRPGEVHALIGMNGSGKSTLVKALSGFHEPDEGTLRVDGEPLAARPEALAFVHQDLALVDELSVLENLSLGRPVTVRRGRVDWGAERTRARAALAPFGLADVVDLRVAQLTKAEATIVAIARALERREQGCSVLVLDEPTSTLPASETEQLLEVMRACAAEGLAILFISHRLTEIIDVADCVTVLRNGRVGLAAPIAEMTVERLADAMAGDAREVLATPGDASVGSRREAFGDQEPVLVAEGLAGEIVQGVDLRVGRGEIVGVAGLLGSGVEELGRLLSGRAALAAGSVRVEGRPVDRALARRIGFVPADRGADGVLAGLTARENASIADPGRFARRGRLQRGRERSELARWFAEMTVYPAEVDRDMLAFSGGNQQKILLARWLSVGPSVLVAEEPTQGVDVHAKAQILERLTAHAAEGLAVVLLSGEPEEIAAACDRMVVLRDGAIGAQLAAPLAVGNVLAAMHQETE